MKFTDAQRQAIDVNQHNILVNAAAGSGKTAVLVERLFQRLLAGATLDSFIVITFTKLAASEMKERLAERLHEELLTLDVESELYAHLLYVESQIPTSHISTIDAFCSFVVREYGYVLPQVTKRLSLIDSVEAKQIDEDTFLELADTILTTPEYLAVASEYIDIQDVSNQKLLQILQTIAPEFAQVADYRNRYEQLQFACKPITNIEELSLFPKFVQRQSYILSEIDAGVLKSFHYSDRYDADVKKITEFIEQLSAIIQNNRTYEEIQKGIQSLQFPRKPAIPKDEQDEEKEALYKKQRDLIKKQLDTICLYFQADASVEVSMINEARSQMQILIDMAYAFYTKAQSNRLSRGRVLFSDISQLAYAILSQDEIKQKWHARIDEVMIDEYQDTTLAQEELFATFGADKLFLVGDMKQAIYRFRQSDPLLFAEKNAHYREDNTHTVIDLNQNFRSRSKVLSYINDVFEPLMDEHVGEMTYDNNAKLYFGLTAYKSEDEMIDILLVDSSDEAIEDANKEQAQLIANQIKRIFTEKMEVFEKGKVRPITFSDIAILTRNNQSDFLDALIEVFQDEHIPFQKEGKTKFSEHLEVTWILSMLQTLSNPFDDIQFATVLKSPFGDISMQQLYDISKNEGETLYDKTRISNDPKIQLFFERFDILRNQVFALAPTKLFRMMLQLFQFEYAIEAMSNQMNRKQNIEILYELTKSIETTRSMTFSEYVYYLVKQVQQDQISINTPQISDTPDAVMIQTFHKSKGLEYPVVFVSNTNKNFNLKTDASMYKLKDVGIVRSYHQTSDKKRYQTIESVMCKDQLRHEALSEEMRLFYVALTRAREKLYVTGVMNSKQKEQLPPPIQKIYPYSLRIQAQSMLDWIMLSLHKTRKQANVHYFQKCDIQVDESIIEENKQIVSQQLSKEAIQSLEWKNEDAAYQFIPLKLSVTELKKKVEFTDLVNFIPFKSNTIIKPKLKSTVVNRAMIGTATHTLFEHFDFNAISYEQVQKQIQNLVLKKQIDSEVAKEFAVDKIVNFLQSPLGQMLCINEMNIQREIPFRMLINAAYAGYEESNAEVLVQGVIDALVVDEASKSVYIIDYKTDDMSFYKTVEKRKSEINNRYRVQADLYKEAIERIYTDYAVIMYFITLDDTAVYEYQDGQFNI